MENKEYSIKEAAKILGITRSGVHWLKDTGKIKARKIGSYYVISQEEIDRYKNSKEDNQWTVKPVIGEEQTPKPVKRVNKSKGRGNENEPT